MKTLFKKIIVKILTWEAGQTLRRFNPKIIAVTGSVGKTSTKDAIYAVLKNKFKVRRSEKSFNSEIGVPLTVLGLQNAWNNPFKWIWNMKIGFWRAFFLKNYPEILVLEIGADKPGDISSTVAWVKPNIAVVTKLADVPVHVENFGSPELVYQEKAKLVEALKPGGLAVLNADDERVFAMGEKVKAKVLTFGLRNPASAIGTPPSIIYEGSKPRGITFAIELKNGSKVIKTEARVKGSLGESQVYPILAAAICAAELGLNQEEISGALDSLETPKARMKIIDGIKNSTIIDDTYNSSPVAAESALITLKNIETSGKKIAILGDMLELGNFSTSEHQRLGSIAAVAADIIITVGERARDIALGAQAKYFDQSKIFQFLNSKEAALKMPEIVEENDVVLVKGSQGMRMERVVAALMADPSQKKSLLVRQEEEWLSRE